MAAATKMLDQVQKSMRSVEKTSVELKKMLEEVKMSQAQAEQTRVVLDSIERSLSSARVKAVEARDALKDVKLTTAQAVETSAIADIEIRKLKEIRDAAIEANIAQLAALRVQTRTPGGQFGGRAIPLAGASRQVMGTKDFYDYVAQLAVSQGAKFGPMTEDEFKRTIGSRRFGFDRLPPNPVLRDIEGFGKGDIKGAERFLKRLGFDIASGGVGTRGSGSRGGGGRGGSAVGAFFRGVLPGGRRAGAGAVLTGLGLLAGAGPAAVPAAGGLAIGAAAGLTALVGAAATLKLAFADMSAAAFTSRAAFNALTPAQQSLVISLKSLDTGVVKPLENIAQQGLIPKLTVALHSLFTPGMVGALQKGVGSFASNIGQGIQNVAGILGSNGFTQNLQKVMVADSFYVNQFITDIGKLTDSFFRILAVGKPFTDWLSGLGVKFADWTESLTRSTEANGKLATFFEHAKGGLQSIGALITSLGHVAGSFGDVFGFKNSIALINTFTRVFNMLADLIRQNQNILHDFFSGAIAAINDLLSAIQPVLNLLSRLFGVVNNLIGGMRGWRIVIDGVVAALTLHWISGLIGGFARIGLAEGALVGETQTLRLALLSLSSAEVLGGLAVLAAAVYAVYKPQAFLSPGRDPSRGHGTGIIPASMAQGLIKGRTPFATDVGHTKAAYDLGGGQYLAQEKNGEWKLYHGSGAVEVPGLAPGFKASPAVRAAVAATAPRKPTTPVGDLSFLNPGSFVNQLLVSSLKLPQGLQNRIDAASAGHGDMQKANAAAYAYYERILKTPGLKAAQKSLIYQAEAPYAPPSPFQETGGGAVGFRGPMEAGGAVFNAKQAAQGAMTSGSGVSFAKQVSLAKAYERSAAAAYQHLKNQKIDIKDTAAKQAALTALAKDELQARKYIAAITAHQVKALAKMVDDSRKTQISQHRTQISELRSNLTSLFGAAASPTAALKVVNKALLGAGSQLEQLKAFKEKLLAQDNQTSKLKGEENRIQGEINSVLGVIRTAQKDQAKALKAQIAAGLERKWERIFGITKGDTASAESIVRREHSTLTQILKGIPHGRGVNPLSMIPGFASMTVGDQVKALQSHGVVFSKRALEDFSMIKNYLADVKASGGKVSSVISGQITALLTQIKDNTKKDTFASNYFAPSSRLAGKRLGLRGKELMDFENAFSALEIGRKIPGNLAAAGVPLPIGMATGFHPAVHPGKGVSGYPNLIQINGDVHVNAPNARTAKELADEFQTAVLKRARSNAAQTRGSHAGKSYGGR